MFYIKWFCDQDLDCCLTISKLSLKKLKVGRRQARRGIIKTFNEVALFFEKATLCDEALSMPKSILSAHTEGVTIVNNEINSYVAYFSKTLMTYISKMYSSMKSTTSHLLTTVRLLKLNFFV